MAYCLGIFITAFEEHSRTKRARLSTVNELQTNAETHHSDERKLFESIIEGSEMYTAQTLAEVSCLYSAAIVYSQRHLQAKKHAESTKYYGHTAVGHLDTIKQSANNLTNNDIEEVSSGHTPRKRKWQYSDEWALTKSREQLLLAWKQCQLPKAQDDHRDEQPSGPSTFAGTENIEGLDSHRDVKSESSDVDVPPPKPLVDSRKRNHVVTRASRRVR